MNKFFNKYRLSIFASTSIILFFLFARAKDSYFEISKNLDIFNSLFKELNDSYVDPIEPGKTIKTGIDAMLAELDPYTNYITEDDIEEFRMNTTGEYAGIGSSILEKEGYLVIDEPYEGSPVQMAGIKAGDILLSIDGKSTKGKNVDEVSQFLRGEAGTRVILEIKDVYTGQISKKEITRAKINIGSVPYAGMVGPQNDLAYVKLTQFTAHCSNDVRKALDSLKKSNPGMKGVVLDLRYNPGGLLEEAVEICNLFIEPNQLVVSTKGKHNEWDKEFKTRSKEWNKEIPLAVLINSSSASASEIVAGTIQDLDRGIVIGQKSFGKGLVQTTKNLSFGAKLKVTTAKYYTPSGRCIQAIDYSHRNEDGSVGEVPDSLKVQFKTKTGRSVWDGGGIDPDVKIKTDMNQQFLSTLFSKFFIFDYATEYVKKHESIPAAGVFSLNEADFLDFSNWLGNKDYGYSTKSESALKEFKEVAQKENYYSAVEKEYNALLGALGHDKKQDLLKHKKQITNALESEIVSRYYYRTGKYQNAVNDNDEINKAIEILGNPAKLSRLLKP